MQAEGTARGRVAKDDPFSTHMPTAFHGYHKERQNEDKNLISGIRMVPDLTRNDVKGEQLVKGKCLTQGARYQMNWDELTERERRKREKRRERETESCVTCAWLSHSALRAFFVS